MRATRSGGYDVFISPPQVAASALAHGYSLVGATDSDEQYLLVGRSHVASVGELRGGQIYLPQQDSIYTYLARGMLNANGLSFKDLEERRLPALSAGRPVRAADRLVGSDDGAARRLGRLEQGAQRRRQGARRLERRAGRLLDQRCARSCIPRARTQLAPLVRERRHDLRP